MKKHAFTLAEVLITLVIIGVIAAMTIPTLMGSTNEQEIKTAFKKAYSAVGQAIALERALYGNDTNCSIMNEFDQAQMLKNHMSVIDECYQGNCNTFKTADGFIYYVACGALNVDVNGEKGNGVYGEDVFPMWIDAGPAGMGGGKGTVHLDFAEDIRHRMFDE